MERHAFRAMGTEIELLLDADPGLETAAALWAAEAEFRRLEALLSRFRPASELSRLNRAGRLLAGPDLVRVTRLAVEARERTHGRFDPTVHDALVAAGYDREFDELPADRPAPPPPAAGCGGAILVDPVRGLLELGPGARLDLGGIAKGYAADAACALLARVGPCLVNAGGDIAVHGLAGGEPWPIGVATPAGPLTLALARGGLATSGRDRRRWRMGGADLHHVIDPATGQPAGTDLLRVTVAAVSAVEAEVLATSLLVAGAERALAEADAEGVAAVLVTEAGRTLLAGELR